MSKAFKELGLDATPLAAAMPAFCASIPTADLLGIIPSADDDRRKWLRHGAWPEGAFPLRKNVEAAARFVQGPDRYPFIPVGGEGVHEIPVGPVHAGTLEPGHFRFSIVGEKILRLEERLGYKHKGIEK